MFESVFNQRALPEVSGFFCATLLIALLIHPFGVSAEEQLWQSDDLTYGFPGAVPDLLARPGQTIHFVADPLFSESPVRISLPWRVQIAGHPRLLDALLIAFSTDFPSAPSLPRPPPPALRDSPVT